VNRQKGLLAFLCAAVAATCAVLQIPLAAGVEKLFGDAASPLIAHLKAEKDSGLRDGPGGGDPITVGSLRSDERPDYEIKQLSKTHRLPFAVLKAHLAVTSQGVRGTNGHFWSRLPVGDEELPDDGLLRTQAAAELLSRYQKQTGSLDAALMAWAIGSYRASRAKDAGDMRLLAAHRSAAARHRCTVMGLAAAYRAQWPLEDEAVRAPMPGRVIFAGVDGVRGRCVLIDHTCDFESEFCGLLKLAVEAGQPVKQGARLGTAQPQAVRFGLRVGKRIVDPAALKPPGE
jgi:murein DD-endopeptidase MepM/ murein hydrolase activator NlpD